MPRTKKEKPEGGFPISAEKEAAMALQMVRNQCSDFFDAGIILVTREINGKTEFLQANFGNQFAVKGMFESFADKMMGDAFDDDVSAE